MTRNGTAAPVRWEQCGVMQVWLDNGNLQIQEVAKDACEELPLPLSCFLSKNYVPKANRLASEGDGPLEEEEGHSLGTGLA